MTTWVNSGGGFNADEPRKYFSSESGSTVIDAVNFAFIEIYDGNHKAQEFLPPAGLHIYFTFALCQRTTFLCASTGLKNSARGDLGSAHNSTT